MDWLLRTYIFSASLRFSEWLKTSNMKPFAISESHFTLSEVRIREQGQRRLQARKERRRPLAEDWLDPHYLTASAHAGYDCIIFQNCTLFLRFSTREKDGSGEKNICLKYKIGTTASALRWWDKLIWTRELSRGRSLISILIFNNMDHHLEATI